MLNEPLTGFMNASYLYVIVWILEVYVCHRLVTINDVSHPEK